MRQLNRISGKGEIQLNTRVSAVFTVFHKNEHKYVVREAFPEDIDFFGLTQSCMYFGFPASNKYTEETPEETAVRAAKQWGFDVIPRRHMPGSSDETRIYHYVFCDCEKNPDKLEDIMEYMDAEINDKRYVLLMHTSRLIKDKQIIPADRAVIRMWDAKEITEHNWDIV